MLASLELKGHDDVAVVVLCIPVLVASNDGACISRVDCPVFVRRANVTAVVGDKRALDKLHDVFTRESEAGEEWVAVVPLGREELIDNLRAAKKCKSKDFVIGFAGVWPREEDSEARLQIANDMRFVVHFVVDGEPHERSGDDRRAQEILNDIAVRDEAVKDGANRFG